MKQVLDPSSTDLGTSKLRRPRTNYLSYVRKLFKSRWLHQHEYIRMFYNTKRHIDLLTLFRYSMDPLFCSLSSSFLKSSADLVRACFSRLWEKKGETSMTRLFKPGERSFRRKFFLHKTRRECQICQSQIWFSFLYHMCSLKIKCNSCLEPRIGTPNNGHQRQY